MDAFVTPMERPNSTCHPALVENCNLPGILPYAGICERNIVSHLQPEARTTPASNMVCTPHRTAAAAAELYSWLRKCTAAAVLLQQLAAVTAPFYRNCTVRHRVLPELLYVSPHSMIPPHLGQLPSNRQHSAAFKRSSMTVERTRSQPLGLKS